MLDMWGCSMKKKNKNVCTCEAEMPQPKKHCPVHREEELRGSLESVYREIDDYPYERGFHD